MTRLLVACVLAFLAGSMSRAEDLLDLETTYLRISIDAMGHLCRLTDRQTQTDYFPVGQTAPLLALYQGETILSPSSMQHDSVTSRITLSYNNGSQATIKVQNQGDYVRFELTGVEPRNGIDAVGWGPYPTTIRKLIGETICVVRKRPTGCRNRPDDGRPTGQDFRKTLGDTEYRANTGIEYNVDCATDMPGCGWAGYVGTRRLVQD